MSLSKNQHCVTQLALILLRNSYSDLQAAHTQKLWHSVPAWQVRISPLHKQYLLSQSLVPDRPASQDTLVAFVIVKAERTAAIATMKRMLLVEKVGGEG